MGLIKINNIKFIAKEVLCGFLCGFCCYGNHVILHGLYEERHQLTFEHDNT